MSWNTAKKRFQKDLDKYPKALREVLLNRTNRFNLPTFDATDYVPKHERKTKLEDVGIASGDMVYVSEGEHKGKVSSVLQYTEESDSLILTDILSKKIIPKAWWIKNQTSHIMDYPVPIPRKNIKLAAKDRDEDGKISFIVADEVVMKDKYYDDRYKRWLPRRFVKHHESIEIPWPKPPTEPEDDYLSTGADAVFVKSYEPQSIAKSPLPQGVLAELRNPYSSHKRKTLTEVQARKLTAPKMPLSTEQKIYLAKKAQQPEKKLEPLSEEVKDFIGERIAEHLSKIENPALLAHLEALSKSTIPDFEKTMEKIKENQS
ncbi:putative 54S ribosomal protein [Clavispora lusitaniae]|uniref:54S ribosomal protein n=2 Tax=Clavispora lusitaniae TaxID=36911 RepID=C4Y6C8_CLAL4|nr:uncharacterized protein CLUG_03711 [Clavispora lusitaniae ATCC 42720]KAF5210457.1 hypothetical protein E0198_003333 [Clavispora lusitaniae]EEQ39583.1 hypothetical protein CLUG_03711 [Clavispora lusitaniae ATCC 42720]KAF7582446.1 hypothetical protein FOB63_002527 [Clavispora lusitaniae]QFZ28472.1 putative 54S ribosomal protein [Clavispora lusitaniae]QFZ34135.1 putative 54S ribosomal protein [Clavispora lusitaniae]